MNSDSPFLFASAWTTLDLVNHLWQSTVVGALILGLLAVCRRLPARTRQALAWLGLTKFIFPIAIFTSLIGFLGASTPEVWLGSKTLELPLLLTSASFAAADQPAEFPLARLLACVWLSGVIVLVGFQVSRAVRLRRRILQSANPLPASFAGPLAEAASVVGLRHLPRASSVAAEFSPAVLGALHPMVILPRGLESVLIPAELRSVLIHECVHLQRRDHVWAAAQIVVVCLFWFHPVVWLLQRRLSLETEKSCDERVLRITRDAEACARGIVKCVRFNLGLPSPLLLGVSTPPVVERVRAILIASPQRDARFARAAALIAGLLIVSLSGHAGTFTRLDPRVGSVVPLFPAPSPPSNETGPSSTDTPSDLTDASRAASVSSALESAAPRANQLDRAFSSGLGDSDGASLSHPERSRTDGKALERLRAFQLELKAATPERPFLAVDSTVIPPSRVVMQVSPLALPAGRRQSTGESAELARSPARVASNAAPSDPVGMGVEVFAISKLDQRPEPKFQAKPVYPSEMRRQQIRGVVLVDFMVDSSGAVQNAYAARSSRPEFETSAVQAVSKWTFRPGRKGNRAVNTHMQVPIVFTLNDDK